MILIGNLATAKYETMRGRHRFLQNNWATKNYGIAHFIRYVGKVAKSWRVSVVQVKS